MQPLPARQPWEAAWGLKFAYLAHYANDPRFCAALEALWSDFGHGAAEELQTTHNLWRLRERAQRQPSLARGYLAAYLHHLRVLTREWGLDHLEPADPDRTVSSGGEEAIHRWCEFRASRAARGHELAAHDFGVGVSAGGGRPALDPTFTLHLEAAWDPREEPRAAARRRLRAEVTQQIDAELERLTRETQALGYQFADRKPKLHQHLQWLYEHVAYGKSYRKLADEQLGDSTLSGSIYNRVKPLAERLPLELSPPAKNPRFPRSRKKK
jgi:hypothetical protein